MNKMKPYKKMLLLWGREKSYVHFKPLAKKKVKTDGQNDT